MKQLSTGQPSTLGSYLENCKLFGLTKAVEFLEEKIAESPNGANEEVVAHESQMMSLIGHLEGKD